MWEKMEEGQPLTSSRVSCVTRQHPFLLDLASGFVVCSCRQKFYRYLGALQPASLLAEQRGVDRGGDLPSAANDTPRQRNATADGGRPGRQQAALDSDYRRGRIATVYAMSSAASTARRRRKDSELAPQREIEVACSAASNGPLKLCSAPHCSLAPESRRRDKVTMGNLRHGPEPLSSCFSHRLQHHAPAH